MISYSQSITLLHLDFPVLHCCTPEKVVQLHGFDGRCARLVLTGLGTEPEVDVPTELAIALRGLEISKF